MYGQGKVGYDGSMARSKAGQGVWMMARQGSEAHVEEEIGKDKVASDKQANVAKASQGDGKCLEKLEQDKAMQVRAGNKYKSGSRKQAALPS